MLMIIAQMAFVVGWSGIKSIGQEMPLFEIVFFRSIISVIILAPMAHLRLRTFRGNDRLMLFLRAFFGYIGMVLIFYAITKMELGNAVTLFNTLPIFVALLAPLCLGEPFKKIQFLFVIIAFIGITIIIKPGTVMIGLPSILALVAGLAGAIAMIALRKLGSTDSPILVTLYFTAFGAIVSLPIAAWNFVWPDKNQWLIISLVGISVTVAQLLMAKAYKLARAATIAPFGYTFVIGSYISGMIFFGELPDALSAIGAAITVACGVMIMLTAPKADCIPGGTPSVRA